MNKKKSIAVAVVLLLVLLIGGMLAYFTDTDDAENVFTIGDDVEITLTETWNEADGQEVHPGVNIAKAPAIRNDSTTTPAYVFLKVEVPCYIASGTTPDTRLFNFTAKSEWALINTPAIDATTSTITYIYAYGSISAMTELDAEETTETLFDSVTVNPSLTQDQKASIPSEPNIMITAYGIQTDGLSTAVPSGIFELFD